MNLSAISMLFFVSQLARAASPEALKAVLDNREVRGLTDIAELEVIATYKCPQCFDIKVSGVQQIVAGLPAQDVYLVVRTEGNFSSRAIKTTVIERIK